MESLYSRRSNLIIGFHGCDASVVRKVVNGEEDLIPSTNDYDWLGNGIYFWENNEARALQWATELSKRKGSSIKKPAVVGAIIDLGYCFDLTDSTYLQELPKRTISRYASAIPIASRAIFFQEVLIRHIPIHSKPHNTKPAIMYKRETINYVKGEQIMTETFGHSKDLITLSLSLSLSLKYSPTIAYTLLRLAGTRVNIRLFLE